MAGRSWSKALAATVAVGAALYAITACNSVLGIEPAELGETTDQPQQCNWSAPNPGIECTGCDEACAGHCNVDACLKDHECRSHFFSYRACVGTACTDAKGDCSCILADKGDGSPAALAGAQQATQVATCLTDCGKGCGVAAASTLCQAYCACMDQQCPSNEPAGDATGCLQACMIGLPNGPYPADDPQVKAMWQQAPSDAQVGCLWYHCVAAEAVNDGFHCNHAIGKGGQCVNPPTPDPSEGLCAFPLRHVHSPCSERSQCCSGNCNTDLGVCE